MRNTATKKKKRRPSDELPYPPAPVGRVLQMMIKRGDARALILAEYARELAAFLSAEESARRSGVPVHAVLAKRHERSAYCSTGEKESFSPGANRGWKARTTRIFEGSEKKMRMHTWRGKARR